MVNNKGKPRQQQRGVSPENGHQEQPGSATQTDGTLPDDSVNDNNYREESVSRDVPTTSQNEKTERFGLMDRIAILLTGYDWETAKTRPIIELFIGPVLICAFAIVMVYNWHAVVDWASLLVKNSSLFLASGFLTTSSPVKRQHCEEFVTQLRPKYPSVDPMMWSTLNVSVNRALYRKPGEPSTFLFLYDSDTVQMDLVEDIITVTAQCFDGTRPIRLTSADFQTPEIAADYSAFLHQYKQPLEERGIMVVQHLDQIPAKAARAFFTICDSYGPLVERAVIFFTIDLSRRTKSPDQSPTAIAEKLLQEQWRGGLKWDTLNPLVVRLTENVYKIF